RENLRVAADSLLQMHHSSAERFKQMPIRNLPRKQIDWTVKPSETVENICKKINRKKWWFIPVVKEDGRLENVIHEDAIWLFIDDQCKTGTMHGEIMKKTVADVIAFIRSNPQYKEEFDEIYALTNLDDKIGDVHEGMVRKDI